MGRRSSGNTPYYARPKAKTIAVTRNCLGPCRKSFVSTGKGNRVCPDCKDTDFDMAFGTGGQTRRGVPHDK